MNALRWWRDQPDAVQAVLDMAYLKDGAVDPVFDSACRLLGQHAPAVAEIAVLLDRIERLDCGSVWETELADWLGATGFVGNTGPAVDKLVDEYRGTVLLAAQLVASLTARAA